MYSLLICHHGSSFYVQQMEWWKAEASCYLFHIILTAYLLSASCAFTDAVLDVTKILTFCVHSYRYFQIPLFQTSLFMNFWSLLSQVPDQNIYYLPWSMYVLISGHSISHRCTARCIIQTSVSGIFLLLQFSKKTWEEMSESTVEFWVTKYTKLTN